MTKPVLVRPRFQLEGGATMGWRQVYLVNERGQLLHTEPVCAFPEKWHDWFGGWLMKQDVPVELPDVKPDPEALKEETKTIFSRNRKKP